MAVVWVDHFLALQCGFVHPLPIVRSTRTVFEEFVLVLAFLPMIIPWAKRVEIISAEDAIAYNDGIMGSHLAVGGIDLMIIPLQASSLITEAFRLSTAAFRVRSSLTCS